MATLKRSNHPPGGSLMYKIVIAALGYLEKGEPEVVKVDPAQFSAWKLKDNMDRLWAWNINGRHGYEADGPCVFVEY